MRRLRRSDRGTRPDDGSHRLVECRPATPTSMISWAGAILATHRAVCRKECPKRLGLNLRRRVSGVWNAALTDVMAQGHPSNSVFATAKIILEPLD